MKNKYINNRNAEEDKVLTEANAWMMKILDRQMTQESEAKFKKWLAESPDHQANFHLINVGWEGSDVLKDHPIALNLRLDRERGKIKRKWFEKIGFGLHLRPLAATVAALLIVIGIWLVNTNTISKKIYFTATGEQKNINLSDNSMVYLDSETKITTVFEKNARRVELTRGRASFSVAHNLDRPFIVTAGKIDIRALGTAFNVNKINEGKISVVVTGGSIQICKNKGNEPLGKKLLNSPTKKHSAIQKLLASNNAIEPGLNHEVIQSGQEIVVDEHQDAYKIEPVDTKNKNSWREGRLYFEEAPLADVIEEVNRYLDNKIIIGDSSLIYQLISLNFSIRNREDFLSTIEKVIPITYQFTPDGKIMILPREEV